MKRTLAMVLLILLVTSLIGAWLWHVTGLAHDTTLPIVVPAGYY